MMVNIGGFGCWGRVKKIFQFNPWSWRLHCFPLKSTTINCIQTVCAKLNCAASTRKIQEWRRRGFSGLWKQLWTLEWIGFDIHTTRLVISERECGGRKKKSNRRPSCIPVHVKCVYRLQYMCTYGRGINYSYLMRVHNCGDIIIAPAEVHA